MAIPTSGSAQVKGCVGLPIGNGFSPAHPGIDYDVPQGTPIYAPHAGSVHTLKWNVSYGYHVYLYVGLWTYLYAHLSVISVPDHHAVSPGMLLGLTGCTGHCTGPHLHYEVRFAGTPVDPSTAPCPFTRSTAEGITPPSVNQRQADTFAQSQLLAEAFQGLAASGQLGAYRRFQSRCIPPSGGGFASHIPIVGQLSTGVKDTTYAVCVLTDVNTYIRIAMVVFGAILLMRGTLDFSKILSPAFGAKLETAHKAATGAAKAAIIA